MKTRVLAISPAETRQKRGFAMLALAMAFLLIQVLMAQARSAPESFANLVAKVSPAVVNITTTTTVATSTVPRPVVPKGSPFGELFRDFLDQQGNPAPRRATALGSGFIISADGYIVTNNHVIDGADVVQIEFFNGGTAQARIVGTDKKTDIALLKVESNDPLPFVNFGDSDLSRVGDWVLAVGNPLGQGFSVSAGIISARNRALRGSYDDFLQTDAAINRGNSGGPLFNMDGDVIGVNTAILSPNGGGSIGIGFSMSSAVVSRVVDQLRTYGETRRGWLGVHIQDLGKDVADALNLDSADGAMVTSVPDGPAKDGGVRQGDVIITFDGKHVTDTRDLVRIVGDTAIGKAVSVVVFRDGTAKTLKVVLGRREDAEAKKPVPATATPPKPQQQEMLGLKLQGLGPDLQKQLGLTENSKGVVVMSVDEMSQAFEKGLRAGDIIIEAGQQKVASVGDLSARLDQARGAGRNTILLLVRRDGDPRFVALSLGG